MLQVCHDFKLLITEEKYSMIAASIETFVSAVEVMGSKIQVIVMVINAQYNLQILGLYEISYVFEEPFGSNMNKHSEQWQLLVLMI